MQNIEKYLGHLIELCQPKEILFISIDGVAPRAKINQQRARRFSTGNEIARNYKIKQSILKNQKFSPIKKYFEREVWNHAVITPGTEFMYEACEFIHQFIQNNIGNWDF